MANSSQNIDILVHKLDSSSLSTVKKALATVAKITKRSVEAELFRIKGGLAKLVDLLKRPNNSIIDMAMSGIANCSMFPECKREVRQLDGILPIVSVLKDLKSMSIRNRAARAIANLAEDDQNAMVIEELGAIEELAKLLEETTDTDCQQSILRGLKIICTTQKRKKIVFDQGCFKTMIELLKSDKPVLLGNCIKTISEITRTCTKEVALQIQELDGIKEIIKLASSEKHSVCTAAVLSVVNLCIHAHVRVSIGSEGGINVVYKHAKLNNSSHSTLKALEGLCYCCREAVNRNRVYECGGVELLLKHFSDPEHPSLQRKIITAFNCFYYNEKCLEFLLGGGIVSALLLYLRKVIKTCHIIDHCEDDNPDHFDQESFTSDFSSPSESPRNTTLDSSNTSLSETFLEEATNLALQVRDAKESNRVLTFKRKLRSKLPCTTSPTAKSINQSSSLFSFSSLDSTTETTSMMSICTLSSTNATSPFTPTHPHPRSLICSTPVAKETDDILASQQFLAKQPITEEPSALPKPVCDSPTLPATLHLQMHSVTSGVPSVTESTIMTFGSPSPLHASKTLDISPSAVISPSSPSRADEPTASHHSVHGPGHSALVLLSRFSQMSDQKGLQYLVTKPCLHTLLDYFSLLDNPSPKCTRLLNHLTLDPQCYESLVCMGISCDIHRQLCAGWVDTYWMENETSMDDTGVSNPQEKNDVCENGDPQESPQPSQIPERSIQRCQITGKKLLDNLACQSQTPFGRGVLMHLLAKGTGDEWLGCVLTLPYVCRSKKLQQQLLVNKGGLKMLCDVLVTSFSDVFAMAVHSLAVLCTETGLSLTIPVAVTRQCTISQDGGIDTAENGLEKGKRKISELGDIDQQTSPKRQKVEIPDTPSFTAEQSRLQDCKRETTCKYHNNEYGPHDIQLKVNSGVQIAVHRRVLAKASDMFVAMFSSNYKEGSMPVVTLKDISANALLLAVHKAYGCAFPGLQEASESTGICGHVLETLESTSPDSEFNLLIEVLATADKFLMSELKLFCEHYMPSLVNESNIVSFCFYAACHQSNTLCSFGLKFLLLEVKDLQHQCNLAKEMFKSQEKSRLVNCLHELLLQHLQNIV